jgi:hypothetical protein
LLSLPETPKIPKFIMLLLSKDFTRDFKLSHNGNPEIISRRMLPSDQTSKTKAISEKSEI